MESLYRMAANKARIASRWLRSGRSIGSGFTLAKTRKLMSWSVKSPGVKSPKHLGKWQLVTSPPFVHPMRLMLGHEARAANRINQSQGAIMEGVEAWPMRNRYQGCTSQVAGEQIHQRGLHVFVECRCRFIHKYPVRPMQQQTSKGKSLL